MLKKICCLSIVSSFCVLAAFDPVSISEQATPKERASDAFNRIEHEERALLILKKEETRKWYTKKCYYMPAIGLATLVVLLCFCSSNDDGYDEI